ncbi:MAG: hypothetical protein PHU85_18135 [Phycisphaerae bacterium]|nr:hypothetical protein [Phycisphaerae bacterium]
MTNRQVFLVALILAVVVAATVAGCGSYAKPGTPPRVVTEGQLLNQDELCFSVVPADGSFPGDLFGWVWRPVISNVNVYADGVRLPAKPGVGSFYSMEGWGQGSWVKIPPHAQHAEMTVRILYIGSVFDASIPYERYRDEWQQGAATIAPVHHGVSAISKSHAGPDKGRTSASAPDR